MLQISVRVRWVVALLALSAALPARAYYLMSTAVDRYAEPVRLSELLFPEEYFDVLIEYRGGDYRLCILKLQDLIGLGLPDGRLDAYLFIAGECYHQLGLDKFAGRMYQRLIDEYPESRYYAPAAYRLQEDAYFRADDRSARRFYNVLQERFAKEPMGRASYFIEGKRLYKQRNFVEAEKKLSDLPADNELYAPAAFIRALCAVEGNNYEKAVLLLTAVVQSSARPLLKEEAELVMAEVYHLIRQDATAIQHLLRVSPASPKYGEALLILSQMRLAEGNLPEALRLGETLLRFGNGTYMFEAAMVLESAYLSTGQARKIDTLQDYLALEVRKKKLVFDLYREIDFLSEKQAAFNNFCQELGGKAVTLAQKRAVTQAFTELSGRIERLKAENGAVLRTLDDKGRLSGSSGISEVRYIELLDRQIEKLTRAADSLYSALTLSAAKKDSASTADAQRFMQERDGLLARMREMREIKEDIRSYCLNENAIVNTTEGAQAKYVDWNFLHMDEMKDRLRTVKLALARKRTEAEKDAAAKPASPTVPVAAPAPAPVPGNKTGGTP
ncbi:MAG: hypothetical protein V1913_03900 [Fibrobacterota bacterium]